IALRIDAARERAHAALRAENMVQPLRPELVVAQVILAREQLEIGRRHPCGPHARLVADGAVAPEGALGEIDAGLEAHRAAVAAALVGRLAHGYAFGMTMTIQPTPNLSATMPKHGEKKVLVSGCCTCPPWPSALKSFLASASSLASTESEKPLNSGLPPA